MKKSKHKIIKKGKITRNYIRRDNIKNYKFTLSKKNINYLNNYYLVNNDNVLKLNKGTLLSPGLISINISNIPFHINDPLTLSAVKIASGIISIISLCLSPIIINIYNQDNNKKKIDLIIHKKFNRLTKYFNINKDLSGDGLIQMKLLKYIFNENILNIKNFPKKRIINYLEELIEFRNIISHNVHIKKDAETEIKKQILKKPNTIKKRKTLFIKNNPLRNFNYVKKYIKKSQYLINIFYKYRKEIHLDIKEDQFYIPFHILETFKTFLDDLCLMRERRKNMEILVNNKESVNKLARDTLQHLKKKLNSKDNYIKEETGRNIINLITTRLEDDTIIKKHFNNKILNRTLKKKCKNI
jgi:hypothetical protein